jgi:hypothetical protein
MQRRRPAAVYTLPPIQRANDTRERHGTIYQQTRPQQLTLVSGLTKGTALAVGNISI